MLKNHYFRLYFTRENSFWNSILAYFMAFASYPKMVIEVFIRKNFGIRYFSLATAVSILVILLAIPYGADRFFSLPSYGNRYMESEHSVMKVFLTWYLFTAAFAYFSFIRWKEVKYSTKKFDFKRFSKYSGDIHWWFRRESLWKDQPNSRTIEIFMEPGIFFAAGILLFLLGQALGMLLIICSIFYSLSYAGAYKMGDNIVMDRIDEMICNEEMHDAFVLGKDASETQGFRFYGHRPMSEEFRRKVYETFTEDADFEEIK